MADLLARFKLIDEMSTKMSQMANTGTNMLNSWQNAGAAANAGLASIDKSASGASKAIDDAARSADALSKASTEMTSSTEDLSGALDGVQDAASGAAAETDYWTDAIGNYDKGAMEAIYTTEELVEMGFKTQDALEAEAKAAEQASDAAEDLGDAAEEAGEKQSGMGKKGVDAVTAIGNTLIGAAIAKTLKETAEAAYALAEAFSDAESTIVIATGASGDALDSLTGSMMRVYAASKTGSLGDTAAAIGEINTRLGYTDRQLETTTALFLDFTAVVGGNVAGNVKTVTQLMRQWDIEDKNLESTLDKLTYAGQVSGKSVSDLSSELVNNKAVLDELGFSLDESIALFSQFELNGTQAASVMTGFRTAISNGTISSLEDLYAIFEKIESGEIGAASAGEIFGARAGTTIVNAVKNGTFALDGLVSSLEQAQGTTVKTAEVAQTLGQKWEQAGNNIEAAFTTAIEPTTNKLSSGMADLANRFGDFLNQHPAVTKAITATGVGLGVITVGVAAAGVASLKAIPAVAAFGTALNTAMGPIGWAALAIGAVTAAIGAFVVMSEEAIDVTDDMTYATRAQNDELQELQAEYDSACAEFGELDERTSALKYKLDDMTASFETNKKTIGEFVSEVDGILEAHDKLIQGYDDSTEAIHNEEVANLALIAKLADMAASTDQSAASQAAMQAIIDDLNGSLNGVNLTYEELMNNQQGAVKSLRDYARAQAEQEMRQAKIEEYVALIKQQAEEEEALAAANYEVQAATEANTAAQEAYQNAVKAVTVYGSNGWGAYAQSFTPVGVNAQKSAAALETLTDKQHELQDSYDETTRRIAELEAEWSQLDQTQEESGEVTMIYKEVVETALGSVQDDLDELCRAYDEAYNSARSSIDSQIGLFDTMKTESSLKVSEMQTALSSQLEYLALYTENLHKAAKYGLDDGLIASLSDGSAESAGYIDAIIKEYERLGGEGSKDAQAFVQDFNSQFKKVEEAKDTFADTVASMETDFDEKMGEIEGRLTESIAEMNQEENAAAAAKATIDAYARAISDGAESAAAAARAVSAGVASSLMLPTGTTFSGGPTYPNIVNLPFEANGTDFAENAFIAGEEGPELIVGARGAKVFTNAETESIFRSRGIQTVGEPGGTSTHAGSAVGGGGEDARHIYLEINGSGAIEIGPHMDEDAVLAIMQEHIKPVLVGIIQEEAFEEGEQSYDF